MWIVLIIGIAVVSGAIFIKYIWDIDKRNDDDLIFWPDRYYQKYCEECGKKLHFIPHIIPMHFDPDTGEADVKSVKLELACGHWYNTMSGYGPKAFDYNRGHYREPIDNYVMILSGENKWKRKNGEFHLTKNKLEEDAPEDQEDNVFYKKQFK